MPISYMGVGGYKYSVNFGTQKTPILGGHILAFYHSIGVDIILGGGVPPGGTPSYDRFGVVLNLLLEHHISKIIECI